MKKTAKVILRAFFAIALIASVGFLGWHAAAASKTLTVTAAEIASKADGVTADIAGFENNTISTNVTFNKVGDKLTYKLSLKNSGDKKLTIQSVADDNSSAYINYSYDSYAGTEIAAGESFDFVFTASYETAIPNSSARNQNLNVTFNFAYAAEGGETAAEAVKVSTPNTGDGILNFVGIFILSVAGLVLSIFLIRSANKKIKTAGLVVALVTVAGVALPMTATANDALEPIKFESSYVLMSKLVVHYNDGAEDHEIEIENGATLEGVLTDPRIDGYNFDGWQNEDGSDFDPTQPVTGDVDIHPALDPIHYVIEIDIDGDGDIDDDDVVIDATYGEPVNLPNNENDMPGHTPNGWKDSDGNHYDDGEEVENLTTEDGGTVSLEPDFTPNQFTVNIDTDGDGQTDQSFDVTYGEEALLPDNEADKPGHVPNGWIDGDGNHYDNGTDLSDLPIDNNGTIDLKPDFTPNQFTVNIDTDGDGTADQTIDVTYGESANLPNNENDKPGHTPNGWTDGDGNHYNDGTDLGNLPIANGETIDLTPDFTPNHFVVNLDTDGDGQTDQSIDVTYGTEALLPDNTADKPGHTPNGWTDGTNHYDNGTDLSDLLIDNGGEITLSPVWTKNYYTITIDPGEGTLPGSDEISGYYGDQVDLPSPTAPTGKKFTGWYDDEDNKLNSTITISGTTTVYAHYRTIAAEAEWWNGSLNNMYMKELNANATTFKHYATDPQPDDVYSTEKYKVVSAPESPAKIYLWNDENDEDVINWWTEATTIRLHHQYAGDMFNGLSKLKNIDLSGVDTSTTTSFANFFNSTAIKTIDLSDWNTSSLTNMANMFSGCGQLKTVTFGSDFDTSKVTNMSGLFDGTTNLQSADTENFDTEKVRNMAFMFRSSGIGTLDLSSFSTPALTNAQLMFSGATNLTTIYASADFDLSHVTGTDYHSLAYDYNMFINTDSLAGGAGTAFSSSNPRNKTYARIDDPDNNKPGYFTKKNARYVRFNANGGESVGTVSSRYMSTATAEELPSSGFALEGYRLAGWNTAADGNGTSYSLGAYMTAPAGNTPLVLYAQWEEASSGNEYEAMQSMTTAKCAEMEVGTMVNLQDTRDNKVYRVGKLADNNCWMLDTLKIANVEISDEDSDLPEDTTFVLPDSNDDAFEEATKNTPKLYIDPINNHGVFYSYYTATAGWGVYGNDNLAATTTDSPQSICPKGWKLPSGGNSYAGDFNNLVDVYGQDQTAYMGEFPGFELDGALSASNGKVTGPDDYGHRGYFWTSTNRSKWFANRFLIVDDVYSPEISGVSYDFNYYKYWENNIVCMAR